MAAQKSTLCGHQGSPGAPEVLDLCNGSLSSLRAVLYSKRLVALAVYCGFNPIETALEKSACKLMCYNGGIWGSAGWTSDANGQVFCWSVHISTIWKIFFNWWQDRATFVNAAPISRLFLTFKQRTSQTIYTQQGGAYFYHGAMMVIYSVYASLWSWIDLRNIFDCLYCTINLLHNHELRHFMPVAANPFPTSNLSPPVSMVRLPSLTRNVNFMKALYC